VGETKVTNGTGSFVNMNTGNKASVSPHGLIPLVAWQLDDENKTTSYMLEAEAATCGELIEWLIDGLGIISDPAEVDELAISVIDTNDVYMVPAFTGLRFPYWDPYARGTLVGLTRDTKKSHIMRAVLEGIGFRIEDIVSAISTDTKIQIKQLRVDGGVSKSDYLNQFIADVTGAVVERGPSTDMTAFGAATLAGLAVGYWKDLEEIKKCSVVTQSFEPNISPEERADKLLRWKDAVSRAKGWAVTIRSRREPVN
jgi:glycerol kinase